MRERERAEERKERNKSLAMENFCCERERKGDFSSRLSSQQNFHCEKENEGKREKEISPRDRNLRREREREKGREREKSRDRLFVPLLLATEFPS